MKRALGIICVVIVFFGIASYDTCQRERKFCNDYYILQINGIVDSVFKDKSRKESPRVFLKGDVNSYPIYAYKAWQYLHPGDTLVKEKGSYKFGVHRPGAYPEYFNYTGCD